MSSSLLERARGFHEDLEIYERAIVEQLEKKPRTNKVLAQNPGFGACHARYPTMLESNNKSVVCGLLLSP